MIALALAAWAWAALLVAEESLAVAEHLRKPLVARVAELLAEAVVIVDPYPYKKYARKITTRQQRIIPQTM